MALILVVSRGRATSVGGGGSDGRLLEILFSKRGLGLGARLKMGASERGRCAIAVGRFVRRMVWGWFQDLRTLRGFFRRRPTRNPSIDEDTELAEHGVIRSGQ